MGWATGGEQDVRVGPRPPGEVGGAGGSQRRGYDRHDPSRGQTRLSFLIPGPDVGDLFWYPFDSESLRFQLLRPRLTRSPTVPDHWKLTAGRPTRSGNPKWTKSKPRSTDTRDPYPCRVSRCQGSVPHQHPVLYHRDDPTRNQTDETPLESSIIWVYICTQGDQCPTHTQEPSVLHTCPCTSPSDRTQTLTYWVCRVYR